MWFDTVEMGALRAKKLWKVEFFCESDTVAADSAYPLRALSELVSERGEALEPSDYPEHLFNYLGLEHVEGLTGELVGYAPRYGKEVLSRSKIFRAGDVLYGRLRPYLNKVYLARGGVEEGVCSGEFFILVPNTDLVRGRFLRTLLASDLVRSVIAQLQVGSTHPRLRLTDLLAIRLPVPPMEVQERVEDFLERTENRRRELAGRVRGMPSEVEVALLRGLSDGGVEKVRLSESEILAPEHFDLGLPVVEARRRRRRDAAPPERGGLFD